jgi:hypothetical protein
LSQGVLQTLEMPTLQHQQQSLCCRWGCENGKVVASVFFCFLAALILNAIVMLALAVCLEPDGPSCVITASSHALQSA